MSVKVKSKSKNKVKGNKDKSKKKQQHRNISGWRFKKFHFKSLKNKLNHNSYYLSHYHTECSYGLKVMESGYLYLQHLRCLTESIKKFIKDVPNKKSIIRNYISCVSLKRRKKQGLRMGKGKGPLIVWMCNIRAGTILLEISDYALIKKGFESIVQKSPLKLKIVKNDL